MPSPKRLPILLSLACLVSCALPNQRANGAFASATNQVQFNWAVAQYIQCRTFPNAQCWNLVLDPVGVTDVDVTIRFENDAVALGPEFITIIPGDFYNFPVGNDPVVVDLGNNQGELQNLSLTLNAQDEVPFENVDVFSIEFIANPDFIRPLSTFAALVSNVIVEDQDTGFRTPVLDNLIGQPGPVAIEPILIPCDFDGNQICDVRDIDTLTMAIADQLEDLQLDVNDDGVLDLGDLDSWRTIAASRNGLPSPYLIGDSNLDGKVDAIDLNNLAIGWQQDNDRIWSRGDFNASGFVDAIDLNELAINWRMDVNLANAVPEPQSLFLLLFAFAILAARRH